MQELSAVNLNMSLNLRELLTTAISELKPLTNVVNPDFRLEQAEYNKGRKIWEVVMSFLVDNANKRPTPLNSIFNDLPYDRIYKRLEITDDREVTGFYIYDHK